MGGQGGDGQSGIALDVYDESAALQSLSGLRYDFSSEPTIAFSTSSLCRFSIINVTKEDPDDTWVFSVATTVVSQSALFAEIAFAERGRHSVGTSSGMLLDFILVGEEGSLGDIVVTGVSSEMSGIRTAAEGAVMSLDVVPAPEFTGEYEWTLSGTACNGTYASRSVPSVLLPRLGTCHVVVRIGSARCGDLATGTTVVVTNVSPVESTTTASTPQSLVAGQEYSFDVVTRDASGTELDSPSDVVGWYDDDLNLDSGSVSSSVYTGSGGLHRATFVSTVPGVYTYTLRINLIPLVGVNPYTVYVDPGPAHGPSSFATGLGLVNATIGKTSRFTVFTRDTYGNAALGGSVTVATLESSNGVVLVSCVDNSDGSFSCEYTPDFGAPFVLSVVVNGLLVADAPWAVDVTESCDLGSFGETPYGPCQACSLKEYNDEFGALACKECPTNTVSTPLAPTIYNCSCARDYFQPQGLTGVPCQRCPEEATCAGGRSFPKAKPGFYDVGGGVFVRCLRAQACIGGERPCRPGYEGYMCGTCSNGFYTASSGDCKKCPSGHSGLFAGIVVAVLIAGLALAVALIFLFNRSEAGMQETSGESVAIQVRAFRNIKLPASLSMVLLAFQTIGLVAAGRYRWSDNASSVLSLFKISILDLNMSPSSCTIRSFYARYAFSVTVPVAVFLFAVTVLVVYSKMRSEFANQQGHLAGIVDKALFVIGPIIYIPFSQATLQLFDCTRLPSGVYVLDAEQGARCFEGGWWGVFPLGLLAVCGFVFGMPIYFGARLFVDREHLLDAEVMKSLGSLYRLYRREFFFFEVFGLLKRLGLVLISTFLTRLQLVQIALLLVLLGATTLYSSRAKPFYFPLYNTIDLRLNLVVLFILLVAQAFYMEDGRSSSQTLLLVVLVAAIIVFAGIAVYSIYQDLTAVRQARSSVTTTSLMRKRYFTNVVMNELHDFESDPDLLRHAGQFLQALDTVTNLRADPFTGSRSRSGTSGTVGFDSIDVLGSQVLSDEIELGPVES